MSIKPWNHHLRYLVENGKNGSQFNALSDPFWHIAVVFGRSKISDLRIWGTTLMASKKGMMDGNNSEL